jgi:hypothetical protein
VPLNGGSLLDHLARLLATNFTSGSTDNQCHGYASRSRQLRKAPVEAHEVLAGQVVDPTERIDLLEIAQGYFQPADPIAVAALRATEPDSIPDAE